jgi:hypothetical protein
MTEREVELVCTTIIAIGIMALIGWLAYVHKR